MLSREVEEELIKLSKIAGEHEGKVNSVTFYNVYSALREADKTEETLPEMERYLTERGIEIVSDGVEPDEEERPVSDRIRPFDPSKIDIVSKPMTMDSLIKRIRYHELDLETDFQRKSGLWSDVKKSQLIESLLLKIPLPAFYFDASRDDKWLIIDGLQRITAFKEFMVDKSLALTGMEFFGDLDTLTYDKLPRSFIRRIEETSLVVYTVNPNTPNNVKYNIFKRINTGGLELTLQEIRHALYQGAATGFLKELSGEEDFRKATGCSIRTDRMLDREFVLRFVSVCYYGIENYDGATDEFLNQTMEFLNQTDEEARKEIKEGFLSIMRLAYRVFGKYAFRKMGEDGRKRPINKAVFEVWCKNLFDLDDEGKKLILRRKEAVKERFVGMCAEPWFEANLRSSDKGSYRVRMRWIHLLINEVLYDKKAGVKEF